MRGKEWVLLLVICVLDIKPNYIIGHIMVIESFINSSDIFLI